MLRSEVLNNAGKLIDGKRAEDYGDAEKNFDDCAKLFSVVLGTEVTAKQFAMCMIMLKTARLMKSDTIDSWIDICGYAALAGELMPESQLELDDH